MTTGAVEETRSDSPDQLERGTGEPSTRRGPGASVGSRSRPSWELALPALVMALLGMTWALSAPLSSSPDEPAHILRAVSLYSGSGVKVPLHVEGQAFYGVVRVPEYFVRSLPGQECVVSDATRPASCESRSVPHPRRILDAGTSAAGHPPLYYFLVGWIGRLMPSDAGVLLMRVFSALLCSALVLVGTAMLSRRSATMYPALVGLTAVSPVAAFLAGAVNPQTFEICLTFATFALVWDLFADLLSRREERRPATWRYLAVAVVSVALGLTRPLSAAFLLAAVVGALLMSRIPPWELLRPRSVVGVAASLAGLPVAVTFELWAGHSSVALIPAEVSRSFSGAQALVGIVGSMVIQAGGAVSSLEAGPSSIAVGGFLIAVITAVVVAVLLGDRRSAVVTVGALVATVALPIAANVPNVVSLKIVIWQGRYGLPLLAVSLISAGLAVVELRRRVERRVRRRSLLIVCGAMGVAHLGGWWYAMYRWSVGVGGPMWWPAEAGWSPPLPWWLLGSVMLVACVLYAAALPAAAVRFESRLAGAPIRDRDRDALPPSRYVAGRGDLRRASDVGADEDPPERAAR